MTKNKLWAGLSARCAIAGIILMVAACSTGEGTDGGNLAPAIGGGEPVTLDGTDSIRDDSAADGSLGGEGGSTDGTANTNALNSSLDATMPAFALDRPAEFFRLDLRLKDGAVELEGLERVELSFVPTPSLSPDFLVAGLANAQIVSAVPLAFPTHLRTSSNQDGAIIHTEKTVIEPKTTVYIAAAMGLDSVQVLAPGGEVMFETAELPAKTSERFGTPSDIRSKRQPLSRDQLRFRYSHIHFLVPGEESALQPELLAAPETPGTGQIVPPSDALDEVVADGLGHVAPGLLSSVSTIAIVKWPAGHPYATEFWGMALGPQLVLNADLFADQGEMVVTIVHEIAHNYTFLCRTAAGQEGFALSDWPIAAGEAASRLVQRFQLSSGLDSVFRNLHESGIPSGVTAAYTVDDHTWKTLSLSQAQDGGFASEYGSVDPLEDIAEYVGSIQAPTATTPGICHRLAGGAELSEALAIPFAKVTFLRAIGALGHSEFQACAGGVKAATRDGIHFSQIDFTSDLKAGTLTLEGGSPGFAIYGKGPSTYEMLLEYPLFAQGATPLGLHRFDSVSFFDFADNGARVLVGHEESLRVRASERGMVLVTDANSEKVAGYIFGLVLQNAAGINTDYLPLGTFQVQ